MGHRAQRPATDFNDGPTFSLTGKRNARLITQLGMWWDKHPEAGEIFDSNASFTLPNGAVRSPDAS